MTLITLSPRLVVNAALDVKFSLINDKQYIESNFLLPRKKKTSAKRQFNSYFVEHRNAAKEVWQGHESFVK